MLLSAEIDSLKSDLEVTEKILAVAMPLFSEEVRRLSKSVAPSEQLETMSSPKSPANAASHQGEQDKAQRSRSKLDMEKQNKKVTDPNQKSLYKKIAAQTHPDKMRRASHYEKKYKNNLFEQASEAMESGDYHTICRIAEKLEIKLPEPTNSNVESLTRTRNLISQKVNNLRTSIPWKWYLESEVKKKNELVLMYIKNTTKT